MQRFRGEMPCPECETFSARDLTPEERFEFVRWLVGHAVKQSALFFFCARGNRSLVAAHILRDMGYPHAYSVAGGMQAWQNAGLPFVSVEAGGGDEA
ncbi:rhodanese-like domain-containing protein [Acidiferrobacter sp.]|uniref:rhodanese-like domain-containing protein n=2 Tax=Acidiferrobacter sp. TaxID=1872107 RepID=UPI002633E766|nr:rhodanese-like domain-containing protein [Acidiferrobacter sp.]